MSRDVILCKSEKVTLRHLVLCTSLHAGIKYSQYTIQYAFTTDAQQHQLCKARV
jgi:hypothetical protein